MFHQLFERPHAIQRQLAAPLLEDRLRYLTHRAEDQGAVRSTLRCLAIYQLIAIKYLHLKKRRSIAPREIEAAAIRWAYHQTHHRHGASSQLSKGRFIGNTTNWLRYVGLLKLPT